MKAKLFYTIYIQEINLTCLVMYSRRQINPNIYRQKMSDSNFGLKSED